MLAVEVVRSWQIVKISPVASGRRGRTPPTRLADVKLRDGMDFPYRRAPAIGCRIREVAVVVFVEVNVIHHQLPYNLDLLPLKRTHATKCPIGVTREGRHFRNDALLF